MLTKELPNHRLDWVRAEAASISISITEDDDGGQQKQSALALASVRTEKSELYQSQSGCLLGHSVPGWFFWDAELLLCSSGSSSTSCRPGWNSEKRKDLVEPDPGGLLGSGEFLFHTRATGAMCSSRLQECSAGYHQENLLWIPTGPLTEHN